MASRSLTDFIKKYMMVIALAVVVILFSIGTGGKILYAQNINNLISQNGYVFVLATGMLLCILTGGNIDLAAGSVVCFTGAIGAVMMANKLPAVLAVIVMLLVGALIGAFQGFWIAWISVPPFIATLAGMYAFRGLSNVVLQGYTVGIENAGFLQVFGGGANCYIPDFFHGESLNITCMAAGIIVVAIYVILTLKGMVTRKKKGIAGDNPVTVIGTMVAVSALLLWIFYKLANYQGIPTVLCWIGLVLLVYGYITTNTAIGRYFYAVGGNEKATRLSGVNTKLVYFIAYANMGLMAGLGGILTVARATGAQPTFGQGYEMDAIAACFIGGASAYGGVGKITGVIIGATLMGVINQGMSIMGWSANYQRAVKGVVLLLAVLFDVLSKKEQA
ncbi:MAG: sugar ABC transporter permease [Lachnospiraceae bacterium]|nr:sugar ABC transporter permease [Lachnospiraceae bacterium]